MFNSHNYLSGTGRYLFGALLLSLAAVVCVAFNKADSKGYDTARREVLLRRIGHELLLQSGDSTSRVLPIQKIAENEYHIQFENELTFLPDSLVTTTRRLLAKDPHAQDYVVNVLNCDNASVAYGYAISKNVKDDIVACQGRTQPKACYVVSVKFKPEGMLTANAGYILGGLPLLAFAGFVFLRSAKPRKKLPIDQPADTFTLGTIVFDAKNRKLTADEKVTDLTATETRVLLIFALSPNQIIERSRLQKEIWEDDGVIVGRSLDMFISKLRKKLEPDPDIKIAVVRGKGYKLETGS